MSAQDPDQPNEGGYSAEAISVLEGLERRRPWSLLATGEAAKALIPSVTVEEMKHRRKIVEEAHHNNLLAGITRDQTTDPIFEAYTHGDIEATDIGRILERLSDLDKE